MTWTQELLGSLRLPPSLNPPRVFLACPRPLELRIKRQNSSDSISSLHSITSHSSVGSGKDADAKKKKKKSWVGDADGRGCAEPRPPQPQPLSALLRARSAALSFPQPFPTGPNTPLQPHTHTPLGSPCRVGQMCLATEGNIQRGCPTSPLPQPPAPTPFYILGRFCAQSVGCS